MYTFPIFSKKEVPTLKNSLTFFRVIGFSEGISFLVLLGIAMPLKYFADLPEAVRYIGILHGILFILYLLAIGFVTKEYRWSFQRILGAFVAALLPFGPFVMDARLRRDA
ncbi:DUF3817 domain-containing protein [Brevibacillus ginsengisoli]|uniref:DUF3817 domain-containing protein n=1 Tax=Brevibacillus ginsengisoli TaxID=363854 RepID=UPI003CEC669B